MVACRVLHVRREPNVLSSVTVTGAVVLLLAIRPDGRGVSARVMRAGADDAAIVRGALMGLGTSDLGNPEGRQKQQGQESDREAASHY
jgi:hypothetical protein